MIKNIDNPLYPNLIELKDINQKYPDQKEHTIKDFNLLIEDKPNQGQFVVLLGPSGCGKCLSGDQKIKIKVSKKLYEILKQNKTI